MAKAKQVRGMGGMDDAAHPAILVMGVSGSGKTSVAVALAERLGALFVEADDHHPPANVAAMAKGIPLTDELRRPWLEAVGEAVAERRAEGPVVLACSALKRRYRDVLRRRAGPLDVVHLTAPRALIFGRMAARRDHFMPAALLDSQIADLEAPGPAEDPVILDAALPVDTLARHAATALALRHPRLATRSHGGNVG
ncbi:gluconate kinase (SKI family) [Hasllibacter halocynthiae]|uniref:Gluconokinase n=1 Tax=Hasllibacter halocynthiae TaxID=595589 RepID=A0A2T0X2K0_9RHOB|nr:gluconokinase [Hasllibacter halocynthiae]PRY93161.1 gluconate kinase (SKI family) [Hasllibacter halocynthiae]